MPQFDVMDPADVRRLQGMLSPENYLRALRRILPRAHAGVLSAIQAAAPHGKSGKLARGFDVRVVTETRALLRGLEVQILARVPHGHLVHEGHRIVARGPQRKGLKLTGARRRELRNELKARRLEVRGRVPGNPFAGRVLQQQQGQVLAFVERELPRELEAAVR